MKRTDIKRVQRFFKCAKGYCMKKTDWAPVKGIKGGNRRTTPPFCIVEDKQIIKEKIESGRIKGILAKQLLKLLNDPYIRKIVYVNERKKFREHLKVKLKSLEKKEYAPTKNMSHANGNCPYCGEETLIEGVKTAYHGHYFLFKRQCKNCDAEWTEVFTIKKYITHNKGKKMLNQK